MKGSISEEALSLYGRMVAERADLNFSEGDTYDFTRCVRPDGTAYASSGKCRKGTEEAKATKDAAPKAPEAPKIGKEPKEAYASLMRKQQELVGKGDMSGAMKLNAKIKAAAAKVGESPEAKAQVAKQKEEGEKRMKAEGDFDTAQKKRDEGQLAVSLSPKDKKAVFDYTKQSMGESARSYDNVNGCLRFPPNCSDKKESAKFIKEFDSALGKLPKNEDGNAFYRGIRVEPGQTEQLYKALENAKPGLRMKDPGYGSYSAERKQADYFTSRKKESKNIIFVTRSKDITPINMYSAIKPENEAILPRGTEQTIRKVTKEGNNLIVELD